jgi:hypothetical protein
VLSIKGIELHEKLRGRGICTSMVHQIVEGSVGGPSIPLAYLHFQECGEGLSRLLEREHFHRYELGCAVDWWRPINGQKELAL